MLKLFMFYAIFAQRLSQYAKAINVCAILAPRLSQYAKLIHVYAIFAGYNVAYRRRRQSKIGFSHRVTKDEAMKWFQQKVWHKMSNCVKFLTYMYWLQRNFTSAFLFHIKRVTCNAWCAVLGTYGTCSVLHFWHSLLKISTSFQILLLVKKFHLTMVQPPILLRLMFLFVISICPSRFWLDIQNGNNQCPIGILPFTYHSQLFCFSTMVLSCPAKNKPGLRGCLDTNFICTYKLSTGLLKIAGDPRKWLSNNFSVEIKFDIQVNIFLLLVCVVITTWMWQESLFVVTRRYQISIMY